MMALNKLMMITILGGKGPQGKDSIGHRILKQVLKGGALLSVWREMMDEVSPPVLSCSLITASPH